MANNNRFLEYQFQSLRKRNLLRKVNFLILVWGGLFFSSCSKNLLEERPPHLISTETLYTSAAGFEAGLNGLYSLVRKEREGLNGGTALICNMMMNGTDNMVTNHTVSGFSQICETWGNANSPANTFYEGVFNWLYQIINSANTIINQANSRTDIQWGEQNGEATKNRIVAEAKAIRAWAYRHLTYGWGDVPLNLEESLGSTIKTDWERTPVAQIRTQMIADWKMAESIISIEASQPGRITKGAIQHFLAETYLAIGKNDSALYYANQVVQQPAYRLITQRYGTASSTPGVAFMDMFKEGNSNREEGNSEALWVFQYQLQTIGGGVNPILRRDHHSRYISIRVGSVSPLQITADRGGQGFGRMSLTKFAIDLYEPSDHRGSGFAIRKYFVLGNETTNAPYPADRLPSGFRFGDTIHLNWRNDITATSRNRVDWPFSRKADWVDPQNVVLSPAFNDQVYLRSAETWLIKAEAEWKLNRLSDAATSINMLRNRANASPIDPAQVNLDLILDERSRELLLEEHRRYTLLRTGKWLERVKLYNKNGGQLAAARDTLFPIPQSVIDANLTKPFPQNPGFN